MAVAADTRTQMDPVLELAYFVCNVVGIKFFETLSVNLPFAHRMYMEREPSNTHDCYAVLVYTMVNGRRVKVGHVSRPACRYICALLEAAPLYEVVG